MSESFLFYKVTVMFGWNMFYLHLTIGVIISKKYWRAAKKLKLVLKGAVQAKFFFLWNPPKNPKKEGRLNFLKT